MVRESIEYCVVGRVTVIVSRGFGVLLEGWAMGFVQHVCCEDVAYE